MPFPSADNRHLLLGIPQAHGRVPFAGHVRVEEERSKKAVCDFDFSWKTAQGSNWLDDHQLDGYILSWAGDGGWHAIRPGRYTMVVDFTEAPPQDASLWMCWVQ